MREKQNLKSLALVNHIRTKRTFRSDRTHSEEAPWRWLVDQFVHRENLKDAIQENDMMLFCNLRKVSYYSSDHMSGNEKWRRLKGWIKSTTIRIMSHQNIDRSVTDHLSAMGKSAYLSNFDLIREKIRSATSIGIYASNWLMTNDDIDDRLSYPAAHQRDVQAVSLSLHGLQNEVFHAH